MITFLFGTMVTIKAECMAKEDIFYKCEARGYVNEFYDGRSRGVYRVVMSCAPNGTYFIKSHRRTHWLDETCLTEVKD
jgi:hypothetical protein